MSGTFQKTISMLYNMQISTTRNRNVIRQGGISAMVDTYSYDEIEIQPNGTYSLSCNNMVLVSTNAPLQLSNINAQGQTQAAFNISNFFVLEGVLSNFILENANSSVANVIIITC